MSHFPLFVDLTDEKVLLIGEVSREKEALLSSFGCCVERRAVLTEALLADPRPALVVIAQGEARAETWACLCREKGILVNVVDTPALCSFYFPAIARRGSFTAAFSTDGKSPAMAVAAKEKLLEALPEDMDAALEELSALRRSLAHLPAPHRGALLRQKAKELLG